MFTVNNIFGFISIVLAINVIVWEILLIRNNYSFKKKFPELKRKYFEEASKNRTYVFFLASANINDDVLTTQLLKRQWYFTWLRVSFVLVAVFASAYLFSIER